MIAELDESIRKLLIDEGGLDPAEIDIRFEIPDRDWAASISRPTINIYLFDIHENRQLRAAGFYTEGEGNTARRRRFPMRINLSYLITAWTKAVEDEHRLLWQVLAVLVRFPIFPPAKLQGVLTSIEGEIPTIAVQPDGGPLRSPGEFWSALENKLKPSLNYVVTLPLDTTEALPAPFVLRPMSMRLYSLYSNGAGDGDGAVGGAGVGAGAGAGGGIGAEAQAGGGEAASGGAGGGAGAAGGAGVTVVPAGMTLGPGGALRDPAGQYTITGAVRDAGGNIILAAKVAFLGGSRRIGYRSSLGANGGYIAFGRRVGMGHGRGDGLDQSVITNCEGGFTLYSVPPGIHKVSVQLPGQPMLYRELTVPADNYDVVLADVPPAEAASQAASAPPSTPPAPPETPTRRSPRRSG